MTLMSKSGRVLVIDDMVDEAQPMMRVLSKNGVKYSYFSGKGKELPTEKFYDTRLVFLDLYLVGENQSTNFELIKVTFKGIFDETNGPIVIILWTTRTEDFPDFCKFYDDDIKFPETVAIIPMDKNEYFERDDNGDYVPKKAEDTIYREITEKILQSIPDDHWFHVHTYWDNIINKASARSINNFLTIFPYDTKINDEMWSLILSLAFANAGGNLDIKDKHEVIKNAMMSFNLPFLDELENLILYSKYPYEIQDMTKTNIVSEDTAARIHKKIHIAQNDNSISPGSIILEYDIIRKLELLKDYLIVDSNDSDYYKILDTSKYVICEISPMCDCFTSKWKNHRILYGIMHQTQFDKKFKKNKDLGYLYSTIPFEFEGQSYRIKLDFRFFNVMPLDYFKNSKQLIRLRQGILSEIQIKCATHVNRLGIISITPDEFRKWQKKSEPRA